MDMNKFLSALLQFLILLPGAVSCYLPAKNRMKYSPAKTAVLCLAVILPYSVAAASLCTLFSVGAFLHPRHLCGRLRHRDLSGTVLLFF